ncbi:MAG: glutathione S-transferase family protein [Hyphomonadaceae bacterium]
MLIYEHPLSPYAQKVRIALREKGVPFECRLPRALGAGVANGLEELTPRFETPVLIAEGMRIFDSTIILEYVEERFPEPPLMPAAPIERARARMIEEVCDTHYEAINWALGEIDYFGRGGEALGPSLRARAIEQIGHIHAWLTRLLSARDWLNGDQFGWADMAAAPYVSMSELFAVAPATPELAAWLARLKARPSAAATFAEARDGLSGLAGAADRLRGGNFKRQFRDHRLEWMIRSGGLQVVLDGLAQNNIRFTETDLFLAHSTVQT